MWERFPPRMRRAVAAALEEAGTRGCDVVTPVHLLLAIARDPQSAGVFVLERCGVAPLAVVEALREAAPGNGSGPVRPRASRLSDEAVQLLRAACDEAARLKHDHVGTEHVVLALCRDGDLAGGVLRGVTHERAEAALREWFDRDMPRQRRGLDRLVVRSAVLRKVLAPLQKAVRLPAQAWSVYVGRSLAHPRFVSDPYAMYRWLREHDPVRKDPLAPVWIVTRYEDVVATLRDPRFRKDPFAPERLPRAVREQLAAPPDARSDIEAVSMLFLDPPAHTRVRSIFTRAFGPKVVESLRPRIEAITKQRLDAAASGGGGADLIAQLAYPLPVIVIAELLGFPAKDYERIKHWSDEMTHALSLRATTQDHVRAGLARQELRAYFDELAPKLKANPGQDVLSALLTREDEPGGESLNREEIFSNCMLLLAAGHETTTNLIGNAIVALLRHPEALATLRADPAVMETAIEEFLRYDSPVQWTSRVAGEDLEFGGKRIAKGELVLGALGSANRDPSMFSDPDVLDLRRSPNRHIAFGQGPHFCLGAMLAKMEASIAIGEVVRRFPKLRLATPPRRLRWHKGLTFRGVRELPVRWDPGKPRK